MAVTPRLAKAATARHDLCRALTLGLVALALLNMKYLPRDVLSAPGRSFVALRVWAAAPAEAPAAGAPPQQRPVEDEEDEDEPSPPMEAGDDDEEEEEEEEDASDEDEADDGAGEEEEEAEAPRLPTREGWPDRAAVAAALGLPPGSAAPARGGDPESSPFDDWAWWQARAAAGELPPAAADAALYQHLMHRRGRPDMVTVLHVWPRGVQLFPRAGLSQAKLEAMVAAAGGTVLRAKRFYLNAAAHGTYVRMAYGDIDASLLAHNYTMADKVERTAAERGERHPLIVLFAAFPTRARAVKLKDDVRKRYFPRRSPMFKHTVHGTDGVGDDLVLARQLLFAESLRWLNGTSARGRAACRAASAALAAKDLPGTLREVVPGQAAHRDDLALDSGGVLNAYGIRESADFDLAFDPAHSDVLRFDSVRRDARFEAHGAENPTFPHHGTTVQRLLYDPRLHGYCWGMKFVSLCQVRRYKASRRAVVRRKNNYPKDALDVAAIDEWLAAAGYSCDADDAAEAALKAGGKGGGGGGGGRR